MIIVDAPTLPIMSSTRRILPSSTRISFFTKPSPSTKTLPFLITTISSASAAADADDMVVIKNGNVFVDGEGFVKKDILVDEGKILLVEDMIGNVGASTIINAQGKYVMPGSIVFSQLGP